MNTKVLLVLAVVDEISSIYTRIHGDKQRYTGMCKVVISCNMGYIS